MWSREHGACGAQSMEHACLNKALRAHELEKVDHRNKEPVCGCVQPPSVSCADMMLRMLFANRAHSAYKLAIPWAQALEAGRQAAPTRPTDNSREARSDVYVPTAHLDMLHHKFPAVQRAEAMGMT
eukprot:scaffold99023_cov21-Tisochrysis_lutea.AAC.1